MSFALARQFGERILIVSDTMITYRSSAPSNIIPGELKAIVLSDKLSVAYSGSVEHALPAIKASHSNARSGLREVIEPLKATAAATFGTDRQTEFLVASHLAGPVMLKVWQDGQVLERPDRLRIGEQDAVNVLDGLEAGMTQRSTIDFISDEEMRFTSAVVNLSSQPTRFVDQHVGGLLIPLLASPFGHTYQHLAASFVWDTLQGGQGWTDAQLANQASGMTMYSYQILASYWRGAPVVGVHMDQPRVGYLYQPLQEITVERFAAISAEDMVVKVSSAAKAAGGEQRV
jgi:hypothetical protein